MNVDVATRDGCDLLVLCALSDETLAFKKIHALGDWVSKARTEVLLGAECIKFEVFSPGVTREATSKTPRLRVIVAPIGKGQEVAGPRASQVIETLRPACVVLAGVCAGDMEKVRKGDIVVSNAVWTDGVTKEITSYASDGQVRVERQLDVRVLEPVADWVAYAEAYRRDFVSEFGDVLSEAYPDEKRLLELYGDRRHDFRPEVHVGAVATVKPVTVDARIFDKLRQTKRSTIALELEGFVVASAADARRIPWLIIKSVQDFAAAEVAADGRSIVKNDLLRDYACWSSAVFTVAYFRRYLLETLTAPRLSATFSRELMEQVAALRDIARERFVELLRDKIRTDFELGTLSGQGVISAASESSLTLLQDADILRNPYRGVQPGALNFNPVAFSGTIESADAQLLRKHGKITVNCAAIYPGAVAVLKRIVARYDLPIEIFVNEMNSIDLVSRLDRGSEYDFVICAQDPFYLVYSTSLEEYERLMPLQRAPQWLFRRHDGRDEPPKRLIVVRVSSAYPQFRLLKKLNPHLTAEPIDAEQILVRLRQLDYGEAMPVWDPIATRLVGGAATRWGIEAITHSRYDIFVAMYCLRRLARSASGERVVGAFVRCFVAEWNRAARDGVKECVDLLSADEEFFRLFCLGSGGMEGAQVP